MSRLARHEVSYIQLEHELASVLESCKNLQEPKSDAYCYQELYIILQDAERANDPDVSYLASQLEYYVAKVEYKEVKGRDFQDAVQRLERRLHTCADLERAEKREALKKSIGKLARILPLLIREDELRRKDKDRIRNETRRFAYLLGWDPNDEDDYPSAMEHLRFIANNIMYCNNDKVVDDIKLWLLDDIFAGYEIIRDVLAFTSQVTSEDR